MPIRLVLADDHPLILQALEQLFETEAEFQVLARCVSVEETLRAVRQHRPDVLLVDLYMPDTGGLTVLRKMKQEELPTRVVLLTGMNEYIHAQVERIEGVGQPGVLLNALTVYPERSAKSSPLLLHLRRDADPPQYPALYCPCYTSPPRFGSRAVWTPPEPHAFSNAHAACASPASQVADLIGADVPAIRGDVDALAV